MIGCLLFMTSRGDVVLSRVYRDGIGIRHVAEVFKHQVITPKLADRNPINVIDNIVYFHIRVESIFIVACSSKNANAMMVFQLLDRIVGVLIRYFGNVTESSLKENFIAAQEVLDEVIDFGYPQSTDTDTLREYVTSSGLKGEVAKRSDAGRVTSRAAGSTPWRKDGILYRENEAYMDVLEEINLLMAPSGEVLQKEVVGQIKMKSFLSGMPECTLVLNDRLELEAGDVAPSVDGASDLNSTSRRFGTGSHVGFAGNQAYGGAPGIEDVSFHPCVRLDNFDTNRTITFIPPDQEFVLMRYRSVGNTQAPIRVEQSRVKDVSATRTEIDFKLVMDFPAHIIVKDLTVKIPCPENTANVKVRVNNGKAKFDPSLQAIIWQIKSLSGTEDIPFSAEVNLISSTVQRNDKVWARPPIGIKFMAPMFAASGIRAEKLTIVESSLGYDARKAVRYVTSGGQYQCRL